MTQLLSCNVYTSRKVDVGIEDWFKWFYGGDSVSYSLRMKLSSARTQGELSEEAIAGHQGQGRPRVWGLMRHLAGIIECEGNSESKRSINWKAVCILLSKRSKYFLESGHLFLLPSSHSTYQSLPPSPSQHPFSSSIVVVMQLQKGECLHLQWRNSVVVLLLLRFSTVPDLSQLSAGPSK